LWLPEHGGDVDPALPGTSCPSRSLWLPEHGADVVQSGFLTLCQAVAVKIAVQLLLKPQTNPSDTLARNQRKKPVPGNCYRFLVRLTCNWYWIFLVMNRIFVPVYRSSFLVRDFWADFWYVCHGHKTVVIITFVSRLTSSVVYSAVLSL